MDTNCFSPKAFRCLMQKAVALRACVHAGCAGYNIVVPSPGGRPSSPEHWQLGEWGTRAFSPVDGAFRAAV
jgi:hypothetical protein